MPIDKQHDTLKMMRTLNTKPCCLVGLCSEEYHKRDTICDCFFVTPLISALFKIVASHSLVDCFHWKKSGVFLVLSNVSLKLFFVFCSISSASDNFFK